MQLFLTKKSKIILGIALVSLLAIYLIYRHYTHAQPVPDGILVQIEKVQSGEIPIQARAVGTLVAAKNVELVTDVAGHIAKILVTDGSFVKEGTPLIQLDDAVNKGKAESDQGKLEYSRQNYNRMVLLGKKGAISQQAIDQALADLKEKKAIAEESQTLLKKMLITAPFDGALGKVTVSPGEYVTVGKPLVSLTDTQHLRVEFKVAEKYLPLLRELGQQVNLATSTYPGKKFIGKVGYISPTINPDDRTISVYADVPNLDNVLTSGLFMSVTLLLGNQANALLVPAVSLMPTIDGDLVYKVINDKAIAVPVIIGSREDNRVQIIKGLEANDMIVIEGQQKLKDGARVKVHELH